MAHTEFSAKFDGLNLASKNKGTLILPENTSDAIMGKLVRMKGQQVHLDRKKEEEAVAKKLLDALTRDEYLARR